MTTKQARKLLYNLGVRGIVKYKCVENQVVDWTHDLDCILPRIDAFDSFMNLLLSDRHKDLTKFVVSIEYDQKHIAIMANNEPKSKDIAKAIGTSDTCVRTLQSRFINTGLVRPITLDIFEQKINAL